MTKKNPIESFNCHPRIIHCWKAEDIDYCSVLCSVLNDNDKDAHKDKDIDRDKMLKIPITTYIFKKQGV